ncbi:TPA: hypothetical protein ACH3X2_003485 [Trebouxia sp. C0005]
MRADPISPGNMLATGENAKEEREKDLQCISVVQERARGCSGSTACPAAESPGSNVNQEVVQMAAASAVEVLRSQLVKDAVAEAVFILAKRQKYTLTRLPDIGQRILNESVPDSPWFEANLVSMSKQQTRSLDHLWE